MSALCELPLQGMVASSQVVSLLRRFLFLPHLAIGRPMMRARETVLVLEKSTQNSQHCRYHYIIDNWSPLQVQEPLNVCYSIGLSNQAQLIYNNPSQTQISDVCSLNAVLCECVYPLHISLMTPHDPHLRQVMAPCRTASRLAAVLKGCSIAWYVTSDARVSYFIRPRQVIGCLLVKSNISAVGVATCRCC